MLQALRNRGIALLNEAPAPSQRTVLVVGVPRSGTSMVANVLARLGVFMGETCDNAVFEDVRLAGALENSKGDVASIVADYDSTHDVWGFKRPHAYKYILPHIHCFRSPRFVVVFRDPLAIALRNEISMNAEFRSQLLRTTQETAKLASFALSLSEPAMLVSYEKAMDDREAFVSALSGFVGIAASADVQAAAASHIQNGPRTYLLASQIRFPYSPEFLATVPGQERSD